jgi:hypothetical protein
LAKAGWARFAVAGESLFMKFVLAILFSVALTATPLLTLAAMPCAKTLPACCQHGKIMPCCAAKDSQNAPAVPAPNSAQQNQISFLISVAVIWMLPENPANAISSAATTSSTASATSLFARNCALLL